MTRNTDKSAARSAHVSQAEIDRIAGRVTYIGIAGAKRSGKDTLARLLAQELGPIRVDSFAAPIRALVATTLGLTLAELEEVKEQPVPWLDGTTPRHMMQTLGTEWGRDTIHRKLWSRSAMQRNPHGAIFSDVRFEEEAAAVLAAEGVVLRITRPGTDGSGDPHASERPLPGAWVSAELHNDGTIEELLDAALRALSRLV